MPKILLKDNLVVAVSDTEFPVHPSLTWIDGTATVGQTRQKDGTFTDPPKPDINAENEKHAERDLNTGATIKTLVQALYDHENRLRALEGRQAVTRQQALNSLKATYKGYL